MVSTVQETQRVRTIVLDHPAWPGHRAGQHVDVRLTAEDGYQAQRSYSIASAPGDPPAITVERLADGEVSPYLVEELRVGDRLELRGPIGGYFVWDEAAGGPLQLIAGGSGVVPLMAMLRHRARLGSDVAAKLLYSSRSIDDVIHRQELDQLAGDGLEVVYTLTRAQPPGWTGYDRRLDGELLGEVAFRPDEQPLTFICGSTPFVEAVASALVTLGYDPLTIRTERYGAAGG